MRAATTVIAGDDLVSALTAPQSTGAFRQLARGTGQHEHKTMP
jgi:hypothetical protein